MKREETTIIDVDSAVQMARVCCVEGRFLDSAGRMMRMEMLLLFWGLGF